MTAPKKLTLADVARMARKHDGAAWDAMTADERQLLLDMLNEERERQAHLQKADDFFERFWKAVDAQRV
jgi:predicted Fe-S protein YdhL (DUF1289 family)